MIGILTAIFNFIVNIVNVLENTLQAVIIAVSSLFSFLGSVGSFVTSAVAYIPSLAFISAAGAVGVALIVVNIVRDVI